MTSDLQERLQTTLGTIYRVERELGGGGMSRVFVAEDTDLERKIVVKVLPPDLAAGLNIERFRREIQLAAKLQHPHIVPLLSAGAKEGLLYFTMPLIVGESLRTRLTRQHELPVHDAVRILRDVVDALAYAHANGVVHRDIKPDNVLLSGNHAVVTDFGVSKALSNSTGSSTLTSMGVALGTPAYMSPEQAAADPNVDHRADIYSLGALAYELLTGRQLFVGMSPQQMLSAHITQTPEPITKHRSAVSPALEQVIMRCLEKKPADRWQSAEQLLSQLEVLSTPSGGMTPQPMEPARRPRSRAWYAAAVGAVIAIAAALAISRRGGTQPPLMIGATTQVTNTPGLELDPAISPDGRFIAYATGVPGRMRIQVRQISGGRTVDLSGNMSGEHRWPSWSPDGGRVMFYANGRVFIVPALGGSSQIVVEFATAPATWSADGSSIAYTVRDSIFVRVLEGGTPRLLAVGRVPHSLSWSQDGRRLAFVSENPQFAFGSTGSFGNLGPNSIWTVSIDDQRPVRVSASGHLYASPVWMPDGRGLLFVSNAGGARDVYFQAVDRRGNPRGAATRLTTGISAHGISLSRDGTRLAYSVLNYRSNMYAAPISSSGVTPARAIVAITDENQTIEGVGVTPDGRWLVFDSNRGGNSDIYKMPTDGGEPIQLTKDTADDFIPQWSRDGGQIVFHSWRNGNRDVFTMSADGSGLQQVTKEKAHEYYPDWAPDGKSVVFHENLGAPGPAAPAHIFAATRSEHGEWQARVPVGKDNGGSMARWTHDGKFIVYLGNDGLRRMDLRSGDSRLLVDAAELEAGINSTAVGPDVNVAYFRAVDSTGIHSFYAVPIAGGKPRLLLRLDDPKRRPRRHEFATDSKRLYFTITDDDSDIWVMELRKR